MDISVFQVIWFVLWGVLWAVYFMLDGFVLGTGFLAGFLAKNDTEKRVLINTVGPVWDGNEVWLVTAGGATFAAFPTTYALMFSNLYSALLLILFALIVRGVSFEFRGKLESATWKGAWDKAIIEEDRDMLEATDPDAIVDMSRRIEMHMPSDRPGMIMRNRLLAMLKAQGETEVAR